MRSRCGSGDRICPLLLCALFAIQTLLQAQGGASGTIVGFVRDSSGAIIPKAAVSIRNLGTNLTQSDATGESGEYSCSYIPPGNYEIRATKTGFRASVVPDVKLDTGATFRVDITLQVGEVSESVQVQATAPIVQSEEASVGHLVEQKRVIELGQGAGTFSYTGEYTVNPASRAGTGSGRPDYLSVPFSAGRYIPDGSKPKSNCSNKTAPVLHLFYRRMECCVNSAAMPAQRAWRFNHVPRTGAMRSCRIGSELNWRAQKFVKARSVGSCVFLSSLYLAHL